MQSIVYRMIGAVGSHICCLLLTVQPYIWTRSEPPPISPPIYLSQYPGKLQARQPVAFSTYSSSDGILQWGLSNVSLPA